MRQETRELLLELIREYPVSGNREALNRNTWRLKAYLEGHGVICALTQLDGFSVLYAETMPGGKPDFLFNAHLDVVPAIRAEQRIPVLKNGELHARGAYDCLGPVACLAEILVDSVEKYRASAFFTVDEEQGGGTTKAMIEKGFVPERSIVIIDGAFASIAYAQKGILSVRLKAVGRGGHASVPWRFENPIDKLLDGYYRLRSAWKQPDEKHFWQNSLAATVISGGAVTNQIPDEAEMILNIRYVKQEDAERILSFLQEKSRLEVTLLRQSDPVEMSPDHPELLRLKHSYEAVLHSPVKIERICGASDARHCAKLGLPVLIIGVDGEGVHAAEEFCRLASLDTIHEVLMRYMECPSMP